MLTQHEAEFTGVFKEHTSIAAFCIVVGSLSLKAFEAGDYESKSRTTAMSMQNMSPAVFNVSCQILSRVAIRGPDDYNFIFSIRLSVSITDSAQQSLRGPFVASLGI